MDELENLRNIRIVDSTLREGEQSPRIRFDLDERIMIATKLDEFFDKHPYMMEAGSPYANESQLNQVRELTKIGLHGELLSHSIASKEAIDAAVKANTPWIAIFLPISDDHLIHKIHGTREQVIEMVTSSVEYAKSYGLKVRVTAEDSTSADMRYLKHYARKVEEIGGDRLSITDTRGISTPEKTYDLVRKISNEIHIPIDIHCHNDHGLALANSLAGIKAGAKGVHTTTNALGERVGITSLHQFVIALHDLYDIDLGVRYEMLPELSDMISRITGRQTPVNEPIIGEDMFTHKAGLHAHYPKGYESSKPELIGKKTRIITGHLSGWHGIQNKLKNEYGMDVDRYSAENIVNDIRVESERLGRDLWEQEFVRIASAHLPDLKGVNGMYEALLDIKETRESRELRRGLKKNLGVIEGYEIAGEFDYEVRIVANSQEQLNKYITGIKALPDVDRIVVKTVLSRIK